MSIDTEGVVMFLHVGFVVVGMMMAAVLHIGLVELRRADDVAEMRPWVPLIRRIEPLLPLAALAILGSGAWLIHVSGGEFGWDDAWIGTSFIGLVVAEAVGGLLSRPSRALTRAVTEAPNGPVSPDLRRRSLDPRLWYGAHFVTAEFFGIIFLMAAKPTQTWATWVILVIAAALGLASAVPFVHEAHGRPTLPTAPGRQVAGAGR